MGSESPALRIQQQLSEAQVRVVAAPTYLAHRLDGAGFKVVSIDRAGRTQGGNGAEYRRGTVSPDDLYAVIFASGTGLGAAPQIEKGAAALWITEIKVGREGAAALAIDGPRREICCWDCDGAALSGLTYRRR
jgi:hypothetical protein